MQIYTKILIGMAVGVGIGLTLGPKSELLDHDLYKVPNASSVELRLDKDDPASKLLMPKKGKRALPLDMHTVEVVNGTHTGPDGATMEGPAWAKVTFEFSERLSLRDESGALATQLGSPKTGAQVTAWLKIQQIPLAGGKFQASPVPISGLGDTVISVLQPIGLVFMKMIKMVIVPLVFASLLVGIASLGDIRKLGRMGGKTLGLYMLTTAIAVAIGLLVAHAINPGSFIDAADRASLVAQFAGDVGAKTAAAADAPSTIENILAIIPDNPIGSLASGDMLQVIFFAAILGIALTMLGPGEGRVVVTFFDRIQEAMVVIIHIVMKIAPYGVAALIAEVVGNSGLSVLSALVIYGLTVVVGLAIHGGVVYGALVVFKAKLPWVGFMKAIRPAQLIAFSTSSSSATLPVSMEVAQDSLGMSKSTASFVLPLGSTVNMDGTALYQGVAAIFIAQVFQMDLTVGDQLSIVFAATMASVGAAGVPGAGMITLAMVLTAAGIPAVGLALILGMDRLLDMFRTAVNVTGDLTVASVMAVSEGETLGILTAEADKADPERGFEGRLDKGAKPIKPTKADEPDEPGEA